MKTEIELYKFWDLQCAQYSAHTSLDGITDMILEDVQMQSDICEEDERLVNQFRNGDMLEREMKEIVKSYEYEIKKYRVVTGKYKRYQKVRIGSKFQFGEFYGTLIYIHGFIEKFGILLENNTVDFVKSSGSIKGYLKWLTKENI